MRKTKLCRDKERIRILSLFPLENLSQAVRLSSQFSSLEKQDCQENTLQAATLFPEVISYLVLRNGGSQTSSPRVRLEFLLWWVCSLGSREAPQGHSLVSLTQKIYLGFDGSSRTHNSHA